MSVYLVDTCVWRDFYEDRLSESGKAIGKYAADFFTKVLSRKDRIIHSETLAMELGRDYPAEEISGMLNVMVYSNVLSQIHITKEEFIEARQLSEQRKIPFVDCLNAVQARNHKAVLVTRDQHYFNQLKDISIAKRPEDIT